MLLELSGSFVTVVLTLARGTLFYLDLCNLGYSPVLGFIIFTELVTYPQVLQPRASASLEAYSH